MYNNNNSIYLPAQVLEEGGQSRLQRTVKHAALFNEELCAVLLSLQSFLSGPALASDIDPASGCPLLAPVSWPVCPDGQS